MGKIKEKIKEGRKKIADWGADHVDEIVIGSTAFLSGVICAGIGFVTGAVSGYDTGLKKGRDQGVAVTEFVIRSACPEAAELIDNKLEELEQKRLEDGTS